MDWGADKNVLGIVLEMPNAELTATPAALQHFGDYATQAAEQALRTVLPDILRYDRDRPSAYPNGRTLRRDGFGGGPTCPATCCPAFARWGRYVRLYRQNVTSLRYWCHPGRRARR
ncbi:hypothetical protein [Streptomyces sp. AP-93]|uniref:hypothetical protein n=1 Tax=Streptomyces sp. AP-93 TaxID=2929048 RepID=UPI001FAECC7C|nr:hypothetical protein [Streptomyces sp. AP-93]MCJ0873407.1 hypothetical protein [Streptomyces sp. AP-93]